MRLLPALALLAVPALCYAQGGRTAVYAELGGNALLYSLNAERRVSPHLALRIGAGYLGIDGTGDDALARGDLYVPVMANLLVGRGAHRFEVGAGVVLVTAGPSYPTSTVGYRYQRPEGGGVFRIGLMPSALPTVDAIVPLPGVSFGYAF